MAKIKVTSKYNITAQIFGKKVFRARFLPVKDEEKLEFNQNQSRKLCLHVLAIKEYSTSNRKT
jgi:hypothetical protein